MDQQQEQQEQQFSLRWNNHQNRVVSALDGLLSSGLLTDCVLAAEGRSMNAHKLVLTACSPYFAMLFTKNYYDKYPVLILKDVTYRELQMMMDYMYRGQLTITQEELGPFLKAAESLQIRGLAENVGQNLGPNNFASKPSKTDEIPPPPPQPPQLNPTAPSLADEGEANKPSPAIIPKPVVENSINKLEDRKSPERYDITNGLEREDKLDKYYWPSSSSISDILLEKTETDEENRSSNFNVQNKICTSNTTGVSSISSSNISMNNSRPEEGTCMEFTENQDMNESPNMQEQGSKNVERKYERSTEKNMYGCQNCDKTYRWKSTLKRHEKYECGRKKKPAHGCPHCKYQSKQRGNLKAHIRKYHYALQ